MYDPLPMRIIAQAITIAIVAASLHSNAETNPESVDWSHLATKPNEPGPVTATGTAPPARAARSSNGKLWNV